LKAALESSRSEAADLKAGPESSNPAAEQAVALYERITWLGLEVRTAQLVRLGVLAVIAIQAAILFVSPVFFSFNLLIGLLGLLARRARKPDKEPGREKQGPDP
jgi:hypothetical protein